MFSLAQKLKRCGEALVKWSKQVFGKDKVRLKQLQNKLKLLESIPFYEENFRKEKEVIQEIELIMLREEMTLHQRSTIN